MIDRVTLSSMALHPHVHSPCSHTCMLTHHTPQREQTYLRLWDSKPETLHLFSAIVLELEVCATKPGIERFLMLKEKASDKITKKKDRKLCVENGYNYFLKYHLHQNAFIQ